MGFKHRSYLSGNKVYSCSVCRSHLATIESMISRRFNGQHGQAYLFDTVFNTAEGEPEDRQMTTGLHRVRDLSCAKCGQTMGWKYERAYEQSQKYKEGKSILEKALLIETSSTSFSPSSSPESNNGSLMSGSSNSPSNTTHITGNSSGWMPHYLQQQQHGGATQFQAQLVNVGNMNSNVRDATDMGSMYSFYSRGPAAGQGGDRTRRSESAESEE